MSQGSRRRLVIDEDFLFGPVGTGANDYYTHETGTVKIGQVTFAGVAEGSFVFTTDEPGGILAITTDTADDDNNVLIAGPFRPADGAIIGEWRFKFNSSTLGKVWAGFSETMATGTPVMPSTLEGTTITVNGTGGMAGMYWDSGATDSDFRAMAGDGGAISANSDAIGTRSNQTIAADEWYVVRVEIGTDGSAEYWIGHDNDAMENVVPTSSTTGRIASAVTPGDLFFAVLIFQNSSAAARVFEVDYFYAEGQRDWTN